MELAGEHPDYVLYAAPVCADNGPDVSPIALSHKGLALNWADLGIERNSDLKALQRDFQEALWDEQSLKTIRPKIEELNAAVAERNRRWELYHDYETTLDGWTITYDKAEDAFSALGPLHEGKANDWQAYFATESGGQWWQSLDDLTAEIAKAAKAKEQPEAIPEALLDEALKLGPDFVAQKLRIQAHTSLTYKESEQVSFLKHEYGVGGRTFRMAGFDGWVDWDHRGLTIVDKGQEGADGDYVRKTFTWEEVEERVEALVANNEYLSEGELARYEREGGEAILDKKSEELEKQPAPEDQAVIEDASGKHAIYDETEEQAQAPGAVVEKSVGAAISPEGDTAADAEAATSAEREQASQVTAEQARRIEQWGDYEEYEGDWLIRYDNASDTFEATRQDEANGDTIIYSEGGKVNFEEWRPLRDACLKEYRGRTYADFRKEVSPWTITFDKVEDGFIATRTDGTIFENGFGESTYEKAEWLEKVLTERTLSDLSESERTDLIRDIVAAGGHRGGAEEAYSFLKYGPTKKEIADWLKESYGWGGHGPNTFRDVEYQLDYSPKGLRISQYEHPEGDINLKWTQVADYYREAQAKGLFNRQALADAVDDIRCHQPLPDEEDPVNGSAFKIKRDLPEGVGYAGGVVNCWRDSSTKTLERHGYGHVVSEDYLGYIKGIENALEANVLNQEVNRVAAEAVSEGREVDKKDAARIEEGLEGLAQEAVVEKSAGAAVSPTGDTAEDAEAATSAERELALKVASGEHITPTERYQANVNAIKALKALEADDANDGKPASVTSYHYGPNKETGEQEWGKKTGYQELAPATPKLTAQEREDLVGLLEGYSGWGAIPSVFDEHLEPAKASELKGLLDDKEFKAAAASTLTAFYTPKRYIEAIMAGLGELGFDGGKVLEPACGGGVVLDCLRDYRERNPQDKVSATAIELDDITARITKQRYPEFEVLSMGFEQYDQKSKADESFDVAITNVPFGDYGVADSRYDKENFLIHDYYFAKALDKVRPGGIVAFITSGGTMDKMNSKPRSYLAKRADLLGAVRLPNDAFSGAGTEVVSDILIFQKRSVLRGENEALPEWVKSTQRTFFHEDGRKSKNLNINAYFAAHPDNVLGDIIARDGRFGEEQTVKPTPGCLTPLEETIKAICESPRAKGAYQAGLTRKEVKALTLFDFMQDEVPEVALKEVASELAADVEDIDVDQVREWTYAVAGGKVYFKEDGKLHLRTGREAEMAAAYCKLRDKQRQLKDAELDDCTDETLKGLQSELKGLYDNFVSAFGILGNPKVSSVLEGDVTWPVVSALEQVVADDKKSVEKYSDEFTKRTIRAAKPIEHTEDAAEALTVSVATRGRVDLAYIATLCDESVPKVIDDLTRTGQIYLLPESMDWSAYNHGSREGIWKRYDDKTSKWQYFEGKEDFLANTCTYVTADEYLSGNIRAKLKTLEQVAAWRGQDQDFEFSRNIADLTSALPQPLTSDEIEVNLGATWLPSDVVEDFLGHLMQWKPRSECTRYDNPYDNHAIDYNETLDRWHIHDRNYLGNSILTTQKWGTTDADLGQLLSDSLHMKDTEVKDRVFNPDGNDTYVINQEKTMQARAKQAAIKEEFSDWIYSDPEREKRVVALYNDKFNAIKNREYDGSKVTLHGASTKIELEDHQKDAIARELLGKNALIAHEVGAGKTYTCTAGVIEAKRMGLCTKPLIVVPNNLTEQWGHEIMNLYPTANILVANRKTFSKANRKRFCAMVAGGDWDAVVIGQSQFERIPMSKAYTEQYLDDQIAEIDAELEQIQQDQHKRWARKTLEQKRQRMVVKQKKLLSQNKKNKDNVVDFEELGVDKLVVDEAHAYKNIELNTRMNRVSGLNTQGSARSFDMELKCNYLDEKTGGRGIIFATGTPVSNTMAEMYAMMRYLYRDGLKELGCEKFDQWAAAFGQVVSAMELAPEGGRYREKKRFARFFNLPQLLAAFHEFADVKVASQLNLDTPEVEEITVTAERSELQKAVMDTLGKRAEDLRTKKIDPHDDNMLKITGDGRKLALDVRLIDPAYPDFAGSKVNLCVENVFNIWEETAPKRLTQAIFCDLGTPKPGQYSVYDDIRDKLIARGVPKEEVAFVHEYKTDKAKDDLFRRVRDGKVRVVIGSTEKLGTGVNIQDKLIAAHDLDCPWRPADLTQRRGRIERRGNLNQKVKCFRYVTKDTFDTYLYQTLENKQRFISQVLTDKSPARQALDVDEATLNIAEIKALTIGDPRIKEYAELDNELVILGAEERGWKKEQAALKSEVETWLPATIRDTQEKQRLLALDVDAIKRNPKQDKDDFTCTVGNQVFNDRKAAGTAINAYVQGHAKANEEIRIGSYRGFELYGSMSVYWDKDEAEPYSIQYYVTLKGQGSYAVKIEESPLGTMTRLDNLLDRLERRGAQYAEEIAVAQRQLSQATEQLAQPFAKAGLLAEKRARFKELAAALNMKDADDDVVAADDRIWYSVANADFKDMGAVQCDLEGGRYRLDVAARDNGNLSAYMRRDNGGVITKVKDVTLEEVKAWADGWLEEHEVALPDYAGLERFCSHIEAKPEDERAKVIDDNLNEVAHKLWQENKGQRFDDEGKLPAPYHAAFRQREHMEFDFVEPADGAAELRYQSWESYPEHRLIPHKVLVPATDVEMVRSAVAQMALEAPERMAGYLDEVKGLLAKRENGELYGVRAGTETLAMDAETTHKAGLAMLEGISGDRSYVRGIADELNEALTDSRAMEFTLLKDTLGSGCLRYMEVDAEQKTLAPKWRLVDSRQLKRLEDALTDMAIKCPERIGGYLVDPAQVWEPLDETVSDITAYPGHEGQEPKAEDAKSREAAKEEYVFADGIRYNLNLYELGSSGMYMFGYDHNENGKTTHTAEMVPPGKLADYKDMIKNITDEYPERGLKTKAAKAEKAAPSNLETKGKTLALAEAAQPGGQGIDKQTDERALEGSVK